MSNRCGQAGGADYDLAFGPIPSRRLGRSLGINNIPPKICSYGCVYCQIGRTMRMEDYRRSFYQPADIFAAVESRVAAVRSRGEEIDYLTFVPDGEPTLDVHLGLEIRRLRSLGIPIAVITNASLILREDVQSDLAEADWVSIKADAVSPKIWRKVDRPHPALDLGEIMEGALAFSKNFSGTLVTETMLVSRLNDGQEELKEVAAFVGRLAPQKAYLSVPTRPPAQPSVHAPDESAVARAYQLFRTHLPSVECLVGYEGNAFASTGKPAQDLLSITAVHPMREEAVRELIKRAGADWSVVRSLIENEELVETRYGHSVYYLRKLRRPQRT